ncbi:uncharacterized protein CTRU02_203096 [Colletotrichum truncatum]|uniref:Uncharacterized protein n=1 Tax=Colletotrichum truncatum TaxID=5467 RepID=A0ACC3Z8A6_COLTU|nr:uncharacterized protein CTRU02_08934 [Colletotrichum truncatum]KAF6789141.1 hypothetical protein CTRU02_08934 [Colletotrichum truncatum]
MDDSEMDPEMAAFMGFSSFGTQPAAKKRKYNHRTDAVSASAPVDNSAAATGANQVAVVPRAPPPAPKPTAAGANTDEIALDSDSDAAAKEEEEKDEDEGGASLYNDSSVAPALAHAQGLIDELAMRGGFGSGPGTGDAPPALSTASAPSLPKRPDASWGKEMGSAPTSMPVWNQAGSEQPQSGFRGRNQHRHQHGQRDDGKPWYEGYYDPKSNENPWERLEKAAGVESRGSWIARGQAQSA